jgi:paraquat-inducible protein A
MAPEGGFASAEPLEDSWRECSHCGLVTALPAPKPSFVAHCPRCNQSLWRMRKHPFEFTLACGVAAFLFYGFALIAPFLEITAYGRFQLAHLSTGPEALSAEGFELVAALVFAVTIVIPGAKLAILLLTLFGLDSRILSAGLLKRIWRFYAPVTPWAMIDVYLLGFLVAYTRLIGIASVHLDTALFSLIGFMVSMALADSSLDHEAVWRALDEAEPAGAHIRPAFPRGEPIGCHACGLLNTAHTGDPCRRCHAVLHARKPNSLARSWAFLIAGVLLYIPANYYPVMTITELAKSQDFTIFGGILELLRYGLWPLALLVFFASITIPLMKLVTLGYMLVQTHRGSETHLLGRTRAFRLIAFIGRWSMIDVFMISILVALVRFGLFANIRADVGAPCFAAVVVLTIFAVDTFDPRLMWDRSAGIERE